MRCLVVSATQSDTVICIGAADGAQPGQVLNVFRISIPDEFADEDLLREKIGTIEVVEVINAHFARVKVLSGDIQKNDIAERWR